MPTEKMTNLFLTPTFANGVAVIAIISTLMLFVIQFCFAIGVFQAAIKLYDERRLLFAGHLSGFLRRYSLVFLLYQLFGSCIIQC